MPLATAPQRARPLRPALPSRCCQAAHQRLAATADPSDTELQTLVRFAVDACVQLCRAPPSGLWAEQRSWLPESAASDATRQAVGVLHRHLDDADAPAVVRPSHPLFREVEMLGVSDLHQQPQTSGGGMGRLRIDGVLRRVAALTQGVLLRLVTRLKLLAEMDPTDRLRPQQGRLCLRVGGRRANRSLREVGWQQPELDPFADLLGHRLGVFVVTGRGAQRPVGRLCGHQP